MPTSKKPLVDFGQISRMESSIGICYYRLV